MFVQCYRSFCNNPPPDSATPPPPPPLLASAFSRPAVGSTALARQNGQRRLRASHRTMHGWWYVCAQGSRTTSCPEDTATRHTAQSDTVSQSAAWCAGRFSSSLADRCWLLGSQSPSPPPCSTSRTLSMTASTSMTFSSSGVSPSSAPSNACGHHRSSPHETGCCVSAVHMPAVCICPHAGSKAYLIAQELLHLRGRISDLQPSHRVKSSKCPQRRRPCRPDRGRERRPLRHNCPAVRGIRLLIQFVAR
jgi:hypothetical protein